MSFLLENWPLILMALVSGGFLLWPTLAGGGGLGARVGVSDAVRLINRDKGVLVDVCEPGEFAAGHAAGARNIPLGRLADSKELPANKALPVLVICATGARATRAVSLLRKAGYANAVSVAGGTRAWREAQLPLERSDARDKAAKAGRNEKAEKTTDKAETADTPAKSTTA